MDNFKLLNDTEISALLSVSKSWVKVQRHNRKHGKDHVFSIDPIYLGRMPRYREEDVVQWVETLACSQQV